MYNRKKPKRVSYNGVVFDSTLELKFALLIEDSCEYMVYPLTIWYNRLNLDLRMKSECPHSYTPDFLVRKLRDNSAHLIEIKPAAFLDEERVKLKEAIANRYIQEKGYDWTYKIVTDREIFLSEEKREKMREIIATRKTLGMNKGLLKKHNRFSENKIRFKSSRVPIKTLLDLEEEEHILFLKKGIVR